MSCLVWRGEPVSSCPYIHRQEHNEQVEISMLNWGYGWNYTPDFTNRVSHSELPATANSISVLLQVICGAMKAYEPGSSCIWLTDEGITLLNSLSHSEILIFIYVLHTKYSSSAAHPAES